MICNPTVVFMWNSTSVDQRYVWCVWIQNWIISYAFKPMSTNLFFVTYKHLSKPKSVFCETKPPKDYDYFYISYSKINICLSLLKNLKAIQLNTMNKPTLLLSQFLLRKFLQTICLCIREKYICELRYKLIDELFYTS